MKEMELDPVRLFKCLADKSRLQIVINLMEGPAYVELLSKRLNLAPSTISFHLKKLEDAGLVSSRKEQYYQIFELNAEILGKKLQDVIRIDQEDLDDQKKREEEYRNKVIASFMEFGKLKSIPVQRKKARIVYEEIAKAFEPDHKYTEREVNILIADFHDDFCTIRRNMVSEQLLERDEKFYWLKSNAEKE